MRLAQSLTADGATAPGAAYGEDGSTKNMTFGVDHRIWYLSQFMTLYSGDVKWTS